jgi:hypothetical protein
MPEDAAPECVARNAAAARIPLDPKSAARVAGAIAPAVKRFAEANPAYPFETEPASFVLVARRDFER